MAIFSPFDAPEPKNSEKSPKTTLGIYLEYCAYVQGHPKQTGFFIRCVWTS